MTEPSELRAALVLRNHLDCEMVDVSVAAERGRPPRPLRVTSTCPVAVTRRLATVLAYAPCATGHIELERLLTAADDVTEPIHQLFAYWADQPLLTRFDGRGLADGVVDELDPLAGAEVAEIVATRMAFDIPVARRSGPGLLRTRYRRPCP
ncbi:hypothetical protein [Nocardia sp. NPDC060249]|uniref:hypothetical protein n=1 Tax=Nocardia sp. NPDC060249 TaxID=3347082 RepID=UPI0036532830